MSSQTKQLSGGRVFLYFLAFFGVTVSVNVVMATLAIRTHSGTVTEHPYEQGIKYNDVVNAEMAQEKLGWKGDITLKDDVLKFTLHDKSGASIVPQKLTAHFVRPTQKGMDFDVVMTDEQAHVSFPMKGLWEVRIYADIGDKKYQQAKRLVIE